MSEKIRRIDEHWKDNLIGCTFDKKLEKAILNRHSLEIGVERSENRAKHLREQLSKMDGQPIEKYADPLLRALESISEGAMVTVLAPKTRKILDIGFNCADDMILDNFGTLLASIIKPLGYNDARQFALNDISNTARTYFSWYGGSSPPSSPPLLWNYAYFNTSTHINGSAFQLGNGTNAAARANYQIQTALGTAPENTRFSAAYGQYAIGTGTIAFSGALAAGGSGTVNEMGWFQRFVFQSGTPYFYEFMLFHDILGAGVGFVAGNILNASYAITL
jgi:hypothetical protein